MAEVPVPAQRVIDAAARKGVQLDVVVFDESTHTAADAAAAVGADVGQIVKSLVFVTPASTGARACLVLVSGANIVDVARLSAVLTEPNIRRATAEEARELTGYSIGGIPPFGHAQPIRTVMDPNLGRFQTLWAAAGSPNAVFAVAPATLRMLANALVAPIADVRETSPQQQAAGASSSA